MGKPAQKLSATVTNLLRLRGWFVWRGGTGAVSIGNRYIAFGTIGASDLFAIRNGRCIALEIKASGDQQSWPQLYFARDFVRAGGRYLIVRKLEDIDCLEGK